MNSATAATMHASFDDAEAELAVRRLASVYFFGTTAAVALLSAALFALAPAGLTAASRGALVLAFLALGALASAALRARNDARFEHRVAAVSVAAIATTGLASALLAWGSGPGAGFFALLTCVVCAIAKPRTGVLVAACTTLVVLGLAYAQHRQWLAPSAALSNDGSLWLRSALYVALIGSGLAGGMLVSRVVSRHVNSAQQREQRFRTLLTIAADAYWEIDDRYRLIAFRLPRHGAADVHGDAGAVGKPPWELPQFGFDDATLHLLRAHLEAREPFRELPLQWLGTPGVVRHYLVSAEPRYRGGGADSTDRGDHAQAVFSGYWGVARDVTAEVQAREALRATESRYLELFTRMPTPLVLQRDARVVDANPAALRMFGYADLGAMLGQDLLPAYEVGDSRERAREHHEQLQRMNTGEALPVAEFRLARRDAAHGVVRAVVRATGVRLDTPDGPAALSIYVDDTERKKAEDAVRRSEAMLSHLVATSPDVITLSEIASGRFTMVNRSFERQTGFSAAEVVGHGAAERALWHDATDRERFIAAVRSRSHVQDMPTRFVTKGGGVLSMRVSGARFTRDRREYLVINARDVTEAEREGQLRDAILHNASVGIAVTRERRFVLANPRFEQIYGWPAGALIGQDGRVVWDSDDDYGNMGRTLGPVLARGEAVEFETRARRHDGSSFLARITGKAFDPSQPAHGGTIWIVDDVTERRQVEQALAQARDAAEIANRAKSAFLANISHELRTPLNALIGLSRLAAHDSDEAQRRQHLGRIGQTAQALTAIICDMLDLSKVEAGKLTLDSAEFDLGELLRELLRTYEPLAQAKGIALRSHIGDGVDGFARGDALRIRQILANYLNNALSFTGSGNDDRVGDAEGALVRLVVQRRDAQRVRFEVHDNGAGIDAATQARLFQPFTQADESTTRRHGGTGLGLSICRELAALMNGEVGVQSRIAAGSCFWVELPLGAVTAPPALAPAAPPASDALHGATVLVVEDNAVNMLIASTMLQQWGAQVEQAGDGAQALQAVRGRARSGSPFDAVLMDVQMPVMSGHEAARLIRREFGAEQLPIIALTAAALASEREQALAAGMNDFLTKPIEAQQLRQVLSRWVLQRRSNVDHGAGDSADRPVDRPADQPADQLA